MKRAEVHSPYSAVTRRDAAIRALHQPERQPEESMDAYRKRRRGSKKAVQKARLQGPWHVPTRSRR